MPLGGLQKLAKDRKGRSFVEVQWCQIRGDGARVRILLLLLAALAISSVGETRAAEVQWSVEAEFSEGLYSHNYFQTPVSLGLDGTVYIGTRDHRSPGGFLAAFFPDGTRNWECRFDAPVGTPPAVAPDGTVYVGVRGPRRGWCAVAPDGKLKWVYPAQFHEQAAATVGADGTVYADASGFRDRREPARDSNLVALRPDGTERWRVPLGVSHQGVQPIVNANGDIFIRTGSERQDYTLGATWLYAVTSAGQIKWAFEGVRTDPVVGAAGALLVVSTNENLIALDARGQQKWSTAIRGGAASAPAVAPDGTIYVGSHGGWLVALSTEGRELWSFETEDRHHWRDPPVRLSQVREYVKDHPHPALRTSPRIDPQGTVVFAGGWNFLYAVTPTAKLVWKLDVGGAIVLQPTLSPTGTVYCVIVKHRAGGRVWNLVAIRTAENPRPGAR